MIFALLLGGQLYGFLGAFIALPIAAIVRETVVYMRRHVRIEPWDLPAVAPAGAPFGGERTAPGPTGPPGGDAVGAVAAGSRETAGQRVAEQAPEGESAGAAEEAPAGDAPRCPECGAPRTPGSEVCPKCGTEIGDADETASATASAPQ